MMVPLSVRTPAGVQKRCPPCIPWRQADRIGCRVGRAAAVVLKDQIRRGCCLPKRFRVAPPFNVTTVGGSDLIGLSRFRNGRAIDREASRGRNQAAADGRAQRQIHRARAAHTAIDDRSAGISVVGSGKRHIAAVHREDQRDGSGRARAKSRVINHRGIDRKGSRAIKDIQGFPRSSGTRGMPPAVRLPSPMVVEPNVKPRIRQWGPPAVRFKANWSRRRTSRVLPMVRVLIVAPPLGESGSCRGPRLGYSESDSPRCSRRKSPCHHIRQSPSG